MERNLKQVFQEAAQWPERDRATLAGLLIETLDPVSELDVEAAWSEEIKRRLAEWVPVSGFVSSGLWA